MVQRHDENSQYVVSGLLHSSSVVEIVIHISHALPGCKLILYIELFQKFIPRLLMARAQISASLKNCDSLPRLRVFWLIYPSPKASKRVQKSSICQDWSQISRESHFFDLSKFRMYSSANSLTSISTGVFIHSTQVGDLRPPGCP